MISKAKRTRNNRARPMREQWVFGMYDTSLKRGCIQIVNDRSAETLLPLIQQWVLPGTIIQSDGWAAYNGISALGYQHQVVIHENHFVDPVTGVHTNNVENYWQRCKKRLKRIYGAKRHMIPSYLDEFMWLERFGRSQKLRWENTLLHIKENY